MNLIERPYRDKADLKAILTLVRFRPPERLMAYPSPAELKLLLGLPQVQKNTSLWETPGGLLVAYALLDTRSPVARLHFECHAVAAQSCQARSVLNNAMRVWGKWAYFERYASTKGLAA